MNWQNKIYESLLLENLTEGRRKHRGNVDVEGRPLRRGSRPRSSTHTPLGGGVWKRTAPGEKTTYSKKGKKPVSPGSPYTQDEPAPIQGRIRAVAKKIKKALGMGR